MILEASRCEPFAYTSVHARVLQAHGNSRIRITYKDQSHKSFFDSDPEVWRRWHQQSAMMNLPYSLVDCLVLDFKWNICGIFVWCFNGKLSKIYASQPRRHWNRKDLGSSACWPAFGPWGTNQPMWPCDKLKLSRVPSCRGSGVQLQRAEWKHWTHWGLSTCGLRLRWNSFNNFSN